MNRNSSYEIEKEAVAMLEDMVAENKPMKYKAVKVAVDTS